MSGPDHRQAVSHPEQPEGPGRYLYKVLVSQVPRQFRYVQAASIDEAEAHGIVVHMAGPADGL